MASITSANSIIMFTIPGIFAIPQQLQGYSADDIFDTESIAPAETQMGLDGKLAAGWMPVATKQGFTLMADSPSVTLFEALYAAQNAEKDVFFIAGLITLPSVRKTYVMANGVMTGYSPMSDGKKVLQPRKFSITWESVVGAPIG